ncbi:hypothetical protein I2H38_08655 [Microvirga sp. BT350]|uniref:Flagellar biosynthesis protein FliO n=2 Tax=Microvirga alba TaxID=2791025 RepID=A0A931FN98_9HYPH|nr:hypothetical protein [Microvirga alba]
MPGQDRGRSRQPRLGVVDIYDLDRQRQLVLLRRDNVEHLLLIGGLNDVVIETNIVRVAGARLAPAPSEAGAERLEPAFEQASRPQVEPSGRPSIETQLAAQLGAFIKRPSEESDIEEELSPVASISAPLPAHTEPVLKPDVVTLAHAPVVSPPVSPVGVHGLRAEAKSPVFPSAPAAPEPIFPRPEPRPTFTPPAFKAPPPPPVVPEIVRAPEPVPVERQGPDAAILSDMAKQLEEALKRPASPVSPPAPAPEPVLPKPEIKTLIDEDELLEPTEPAAPTEILFEEEEEVAQEPEPVARAMPPVAEPVRPLPPPVQPAPPPAPPKAAEPAPAAPVKKAPDPFSVDEIEAEFARLLGRPTEPGKKE